MTAGARAGCYALAERFRYVHEPLLREDQPIPLLGRSESVATMARRIIHSNGGSFLVTGFRGVGKTTVVGRVLALLRTTSGTTRPLIAIKLSVARPLTMDELMFEIVRRLFEALVDERVFETLDPQVQQALVLSYARTSLSYKETRAEAVERSGAVSLGPTKSPLGRLGVGLSRKSMRSLASEASFLAYTVADVEHDLMRIVELVQRPRRQSRRVILRRFRGRSAARSDETGSSARVVVVLDELDKLTESEEGRTALESLLSGMKNLLTMEGIHFIFLGGPDAHDMVFRQKRRGESVYESVFSWQVYIPCLWDSPRALLSAVALGDVFTPDLEAFIAYLSFKARGIPRLLLHELNEFVAWDSEGRAFLELDAVGLERIEFYASLERLLDDLRARLSGDGLFEFAIDYDRRRLGIYYVVDWILSSGRDFTIDQIVTEIQEALGAALQIADHHVRAVVEYLAEVGIVETVRRFDAAGTIIGDVPGAQADIFRLAPDVREKLGIIARQSESERADQAEWSTPSIVTATAHAPGKMIGRARSLAGFVNESGRYELLDEIARGGMSVVYRARDTRLGRDVAVKLLPEFFFADEIIRERMRREAELAAKLRHPHIVPIYDVFEEESGSYGIVMELVEGETLRNMIVARTLTTERALKITFQLLDVLSYMSSWNVARLDLKPENVIVRDDDQAVVLDFGIAKNIGLRSEKTITGEATTVGTPAYMSPEQAMGVPDIDIRTDIYSLGLILFEMLTGRPAKDEDENPMTILFRTVNDDIDVTGLDTTEALREVVARAVMRDRDERFQTPEDMRAALAATIEGSRVVSAPPTIADLEAVKTTFESDASA